MSAATKNGTDKASSVIVTIVSLITTIIIA